MKNKVPAQAQVNKMEIPDTPNILSELTDFETRLLAKRYPFMKIVQLPKGRQSGIIGRVVNVPVEAENVCNSLPRTLSTSGILPVKLKRKKSYKGHVTYQNIRPNKVKQAFTWLLQNNRHYQNVVESFEWDKKSKSDNPGVWQSFTDEKNKVENGNGSEENDSESESTDSHTSDADSMDDGDVVYNNHQIDETEFDTCLQPTDPTIDTCNILSIAPGEGNHPLHLMMDPGCEEQSFPCLFPTGCYGFDAERDIKITPKKYFNARVLGYKGTFARNIEYLFFAQYVAEHKQVSDSVSIALRKTYRTSATDCNMDAGFIKNPSNLNSLILKDSAYNFLQTIRGSPPYWQKCMYKLMAAVKHFGIFTFFVTLSCADLKWTDTLNSVLRQQGKKLNDEEIMNLSWEEKCALLRSNPVTTARHFDHRLQSFFNDILLGEAQPLGKVTHFCYRIEFQQRGSPHAHCVLWVEKAPHLNDSTEDISDFIDHYITCKIPKVTDDQTLHNLVTSVQKHHHTATCKKKGTNCRFHYPKLPSPKTIIASPLESDCNVFTEATIETAFSILTDINQILENNTDDKIDSIEKLCQCANITPDQYLYCLSITKRGRTVVLERCIDEMFINPYNPTMLMAWEANLDVQFCLDPYACIAYMVSYITKDEREMSTVLKNVSREMCGQNWQQQLRSCAHAFLNARELSAQEAVYRLLGLPLFKSNFSTVFVPAQLPEKRVTLLKPMSSIASMEDDEEDIFTISIIDRYAARPDILSDMCLAHFAVTFSPSNTAPQADSDDESHQQTSNVIQLKNNCGTMKKNSKKFVLRYHHVSELKHPEEYYYTQLLLFLPWTKEEELLELPSWKSHYDENVNIILENKSEVEHHTDIITQAIQQFEEFGPPTHTFDDISPSTVQENDDEPAIADEEFAILNPDNDPLIKEPSTDLPISSVDSSSSLSLRPGYWPEQQFCAHIRNLNTEQRAIFQTVFKWCEQKVQSKKMNINLDQLLLFISGGAGTGKSHLISAIYQMALRTLQTEGQNPDEIHILLTAPTGTAAHNISGTTLHSAFLLPLGQTKSFLKLSDDKRNTLRAKLGYLDILIVDEISMVGANLLLQLHYRMSEIMGSSKLFGGASVIVLGDLYQLPPVKQQFIFNPVTDKIARLHGSLWNCFQFAELKKIMRQKEDLMFAELLNRLRTGSHTKDDIKILKSKEISENDRPYNCLHVYARNCDVDAFNNEKLLNLQQQVETFVAIDKKPESLKTFDLQKDSKFTGGLSSEVVLALGARVMLIRNLNISDGLVNGSQGTIVAFIRSGKGDTLAIAVEFDNPNVGRETRQNSPYTLQLKAHQGATPVLRSETTFTVARKNNKLTVTRYQFPLKLAWSCTIHKVQGLTMDEIVVSFNGRFGSGQAYVALSRAKTLEGLHLIDLDTDKIKTNKSVKKEMDRIRNTHSLIPYYECFTRWKEDIVLSLLNVRSFLCHRQDILNDPIAIRSDILVLSETWLNENITYFKDFESDFFIQRSDKLSENDGRGGGAMILARKSSFYECLEVSSISTNFLQIICCKLRSTNFKTLYVIGVYNSPSPNNRLALLEIQLIAQIQQIKDNESPSPIIIAGDFNHNAIADSTAKITQMLMKEGFKQYLTMPTHASGSCLDHIYGFHLGIKGPITTPAYYSDHTWVCCGVIQQQ